jgi:hypothetical protein
MKTKGYFTTFWKVDSISAGETIKLTIDSVDEGDYGLVLTFVDGSKLTLNLTNGRRLEQAFGDETDLWLGKVVELSRGEAPFKGEMVHSIVLTPVSPPLSKDEQISLLPKNPNPIDDSDIPF